MASSLPSVVAVFPPLSCSAGYLSNSRSLCVSSSGLWSRVVCRHNGVGVLWAGLRHPNASPQAKAGSENGIAANVEAKPKAKPRKRVKKPVKDVEVAEGVLAFENFATEVAEAVVEEKPQEETGAGSSASALKRRNAGRGKGEAANGTAATVSSARCKGDDDDDDAVLQFRGDDSGEGSSDSVNDRLPAAGAVVPVKDVNATRRTRAVRSGGGAAAKRGVSKIRDAVESLEASKVSATTRVEMNGDDEEKAQQSDTNSRSGKKKSSAPLRSRTRRKKKATTVVGQEASSNGSMGADIEESSSASGDEAKGLELHRSSSEDRIEEIRGELSDAASVASALPMAAGGEHEGNNNASPLRKQGKKGKKSGGEKLAVEGELQSRAHKTEVLVSANGELNGNGSSVGMPVREADAALGVAGSAEKKDEMVDEEYGDPALDDTTEIRREKSAGEMKKRRRQLSKKKPIVSVGLEENTSKEDKDDDEQTVILAEITSSKSELVIAREDEFPTDSSVDCSPKEDESLTDSSLAFSREHVEAKAAGSDDVPSGDKHVASEEEAAPRGADDGVSPKVFAPPKKRRVKKRRPTGREKTAIVVQAVDDVGGGEGDESLESGVLLVNVDIEVNGKRNGAAAEHPEAAVTTDAKIAIERDVVATGMDRSSDITADVKSSSKLQFPAPNWGPKWWEEIEAKSQATISFQEVAERKEESQTRPPAVLQDPTGDSGEKPQNRKDAKRTTDQSKAEVDSDTPQRGESVNHWHESLDRSGKGGVKLRLSQKLTQEFRDEWLKKKMRQMVRPTEEPWLLESMILAQAELVAPPARKQEVLEAPPQSLREVPTEALAVADPAAAAEVRDAKKEPEMEVEILINSSECTMQRMAILENKKLVEFSIEPVNTKVQVGNVYLGRVKQLLPGMSGVFVDIGGPRLALLDISRNQYPYTFPPVFMPDSSWSENSSADGVSSQDEELDYSDDEDDDGNDGHGEELVQKDELDGGFEEHKVHEERDEGQARTLLPGWRPHERGSPITVNFGRKFSKWRKVEEGMPIIVQVKKESMGKKGPRLTAFPTLAGRFWVLIPRGNSVGVSARITGPERRRLKLIAQALQPQDLGITVRTEAVGHEQEELEKDLARLMDTWKEIMEKAAAAALAVERGEEAAVPVLLHREMGQTLTIIRDFFTDKVSRLVVDSSQSYQEVITYLQEVAPHLMSRVVLYSGKIPIFDVFNVEADLERFSNQRVKLPNGGYLVMEETEALVSIDVNGGTGMLGHSTRQREAILDVNLAAARQIASEIRLRDIGGIIVVDFIDMDNANDEKLVHEEMRKEIQRDRSKVTISEISEFGLMEMTRKRVRPSVTLTINDSCATCKGTGRVEALETTLSKIERAIRRLLAERPERGEAVPDANKWPQVLLRIEPSMLEYLKSWKKKRIIQLSNSLKVWISLKVAMELPRGQFQVIEVPRAVNERPAAAGPQVKLQQQKAVSAPLMGKRVWPKRRRFFSK